MEKSVSKCMEKSSYPIAVFPRNFVTFTASNLPTPILSFQSWFFHQTMDCLPCNKPGDCVFPNGAEIQKLSCSLEATCYAEPHSCSYFVFLLQSQNWKDPGAWLLEDFAPFFLKKCVLQKPAKITKITKLHSQSWILHSWKIKSWK